jgi:hypothetical protein
LFLNGAEIPSGQYITKYANDVESSIVTCGSDVYNLPSALDCMISIGI